MQALAAAPAATVPDVASVSAPSDPPAADVAEEGTPITGRIPLPRHRPRISMALVSGPVPVPRPRPTDVAADPALPPQQQPQQRFIPTFDRHAVEQ
jgi:hypothetical protein